MSTFQSHEDLDDLDWALLEHLQSDARLSFNELGRRVHLSSPSVAERVRRLERRGVIRGYRAQVDAGASGYPVTAFVQLRCALGACLLKTTAADDFPEITEVHKLSGEYCTMLKVRARSLGHFEGVVEQLGTHGTLNTHIVLSTQYEDPSITPPRAPQRPVTDSAGWRTPRA